MVVLLAMMTQQQALAKMEIQGSVAAEIKMFQNQPLKRWSVSAENWQAHEVVKVTEIERQEIYRSPEATYSDGIAAPTYLGVRDATCGSGPWAYSLMVAARANSRMYRFGPARR